MHGLANRALQGFIQDTYGDLLWGEVAERVGLDPPHFESMMHYDDQLTFDVVAAASEKLGKAPSGLLEDLGTYLVSHANMWRVRRLLRYGGDDFVDFLQSLDDLYDRAMLALPDEQMPRFAVTELGNGIFHVDCGPWPPGIEHILMGAVRAMADDYGALVLLELLDRVPPDDGETTGSVGRLIEVHLLSARYAEGRSFELAAHSR